MTLVNVLVGAWQDHPFLVTPGLLFLGLMLYEFLRPKLPFEVHPRSPKLPMVGARRGEWFPRIRAMWRNARDFKAATQEAYQYKDQACLVPIVDLGDVVILPPSEAQWYGDQSEDDMSTHYQQLNTFQLKFTITDPRLVEDAMPIHQILINSTLTRETNALLPAMAREVATGIDGIWGTDVQNVSELCLMDNLPTIVSRVANRVFVGPDMCADSKLVDAAMYFARCTGLTSVLLRCSPQMLRPLVSLLVTGPQKMATRRFFNRLRPEVKRRQAELAAAKASSPDKGDAKGKKYNDFLQWSIEAAFQSGDPYMMKPETIMGRVLLVNFVSIHISSMVLASVLFDLAANSPQYIEELRAEIVSALKKHGGQWDKRALNDMPKLDSTFRESQRLNSIVTVASPRPVCKPEGMTTPSGVHLPYGTCAALLSYPILHDPDLYPDPETFKPFRFSERREEAGQQGEVVERMRQGWISVTPSYTAFGTGRHACPGRFFASNMLKITLAYILLNYDIEQLPERPENVMFSVSILPPFKATIKYKRRKEPLYTMPAVDAGNAE